MGTTSASQPPLRHDETRLWHSSIQYQGRAMRTDGYFLIMRNLRISLLAFITVLAGFVVSATPASLDDAKTAYTSARYEEVVRLLASASKDEMEARFLLGRAQYQLGRFQEATSILESVAALPGTNSRHFNWLGRAYGMQAESANPFSAMGLARKARDAFQKAVERDPRDLEAVSDLFSFYLAAPSFLGGGLQKARDLAETIRTVDAAEYAGMQAQIAEKEKDYKKAEAAYREAIRLEPKRVGRRMDLAKFFTRREHFSRADELLAEARTLEPGAARLLYDEADLLYRSGREPARAMQLLRQYKTAAKGPNDPPPFEIAQLMSKLEKLEKDSRGR
jgi:tetratricopeptide (TPR) repeat protein